jgi:cysteinyl-tRNA synthetase
MSKFFNIEIQFALGVTDIDDKIINKMYPKKSIEAMKTMTSSYEDSFFEDLNSLRVQKPSLVLRVSEHIEHILQYIGKLIDLNKAYTIDGDVYFAVDPAASDRSARFGPLPDENESDSKAAKNAKKRYFRDFALWKAAKDHEPSWESPWGRGRPGWHIGRY